MELHIPDFNLLTLIWFIYTSVLLVFALIVWSNTTRVKDLNGHSTEQALVSVMIPARNESDNINAAVKSVMQQSYPNIELLVLDDHSDDDTWLKLISLQWMYPKLKIAQSKALPEGWLGKNHACHQLSTFAQGEYLVFMDADVRPEPGAIHGTIGRMQEEKLDFLSAFPEQTLSGKMEKQVVPFMDFFLYTFLPFILIKNTHNPAFAAANGQWMVFKKSAYQRIGGHEAVRKKVIEDMALARNIKASGLKMQLYTGLNLVKCRMYASADEVKAGFGKNAFAAAGYSASNMLLFLTLLSTLFLLPFFLFPIYPLLLLNIAIILGMKWKIARTLKHPIPEAVWQHPVSFIKALQVCISSMQQYAKGTARWKGRSMQAPQS
jgi:glycosyltransferase involved in cell wall biosynthesis